MFVSGCLCMYRWCGIPLGLADMAPPKYKDLGKKANDILNEDFKFEQTFELKSKLNGMEGRAHRDTPDFSNSCHLALIPHGLALDRVVLLRHQRRDKLNAGAKCLRKYSFVISIAVSDCAPGHALTT